MKKELYQTIEAHMLHCMQDPVHDKEHLYRVLYNALDIAATEEGVDYDVLIAACLLHDIGRDAQYKDPTLCHAEVGADMAAQFLTGLGLPQDYVHHVTDCVRAHRFRSSSTPKTIEAKILFDADKLDVTGALGIARTLQYAALMCDEPLYTLLPDGSVATGNEPNAPESYLREHHFKLKKQQELFFTKRAAEIAAPRKKILEDYAAALYAEAQFGRREAHEALARLIQE